jgi:hypothetical protein
MFSRGAGVTTAGWNLVEVEGFVGISEDRWTCPDCDRTYVVPLRGAARATLRAVQERHAEEHGTVDGAGAAGRWAGGRVPRGAVSDLQFAERAGASECRGMSSVAAQGGRRRVGSREEMTS